MPTMSESLKPESSDQEIGKAIQDTVAKLVEEGFNQDQAVAIAFQQAEKATGKTLSRPQQSRSRSAI